MSDAPKRVLFVCVENSNRSQMAEAFARMLPHWVLAGASMVGGCCGTTEEHIAAMAHRVKEWDTDRTEEADSHG